MEKIRIGIDLPIDVVERIQKIADENKRKRKAQIELVLESMYKN